MDTDRLLEFWDATPPAPGEWMEITTVLDVSRSHKKFMKYVKREIVLCDICEIAPIKHSVLLDDGLMAYFYIVHYEQREGNAREIISPFDERVLFDHKQEAFKLNWQPFNWVDEDGTVYHSTPSERLMHPCLVGIEGMAYPAVWHPTKGFTDADNKPIKKHIEWWCFMPKPPERGDNVISFQGMETD